MRTLALLLLIATPPLTARPGPASPPGSGAAETAATEPAGQFEQMQRISPPPALSGRELGSRTIQCELGAPVGRGETEGKTYRCGILTVPMRWEHPDGPGIDLHYIVVKATGPDPAPDPLVYLAGGPGQSAILTDLAHYEPVRRRRDIVRLDQRGTGLSQRLGLEECQVLAMQDPDAIDEVDTLAKFIASTEDDEADRSNPSPDDLRFDARVRRLCARAFRRRGLDLDAFTSQQSARDLLALLRALDYETFNLHGVSYGSRLAMTLMSMMPGMQDAPALRSVVLDSTLPPSVYLLSSFPRATHDPLMQLLSECERDAACRGRFPNLEARLGALLDELDAAPLEVDGEVVTTAGLVEVLSDLGGTRAGHVPRMIAELERGDAATYRALRDKAVGTDPPEGIARLGTSDPVQAALADAMALPAREEQRAARAARPTREQQAEREFRAQRTLTLTGLAYFLNLNIHCNEDYAFERYEDGLNVVHDLEFPQFADLAYLQAQSNTCLGWPGSAAPVSVKDPVRSTVPTLILQGAYDTRTPVYMGRRASRELENGRLVIVPQQGHEVWTSPGTCAGRIAAAFVEDPQREPDLSCLAARRPKWAGID